MSTPRTVTFTREARESLHSLHIQVQRVLKAFLKRLASEVDPGIALVDELTGYRRVRVGKYRIIFRLTTTELSVDLVGHRRNVYKDARRLLDRQRRTARGDSHA